MLSLPRPASREYTERGVQTDPAADEASSSAPAPAIDQAESKPEPATITMDPAAESSPAAHPHSRSSTQFDSAYSQEQIEISFDSMSSEANQSMTTTSRAYKREQLPANRPSTLLERQFSSRIFSLPEATPKFSMKKILGKKTARVVSMPAATPGVATDSLDISTHAGDPFGSEGEEHTRVRVKSQATDVPNQLSVDFLRPRPDDPSSPESDGEDWLTWSESPPRPIPALHGPLSLPYARCPSGAEGTIIEEPESLPRVIWGLDPDSKGNRPSQDAGPPRTTHKKAASQSDPPDRSKVKQEPVQPTVQTTRAVKAPDASKASQSAMDSSAPQQRPQPPEFILKHSEPIDLGRLVGNTPEVPHYTPLAGHAPRNPSRQSPFQHQLLTPELVHELSPELQAMLFAQERLRNQGLSPPALGTPHDTGGLLTPSWSTGSAVSLLESLKSSRSPIVLDDFAAPHGSYSQDLSSQMSALGLAQKYRQQQLQHGLLPTPPSSTSPIWSSTFSPYQSGLLSPELLAAAGLSQLNPNYLSSQAFVPRLDAMQAGLKATAGAIGNFTPAGHRADRAGLAPPVQINNTSAHRLPPRLAAECTRRRAGHGHSVNPQLKTDNLGRHSSSPIRGVAQSPVVPKPPPNTPYGVATSYNATRLDSRTQDPGLAVPPSPTSPSDTLGLPQNARSVPLSRLMHRRLSVVPEEDYASSAENSWTPSTKTRAHAGTARGDASGLHLYLSSSSRPNANAASLSTLGGTLGAQYGIDDRTAAADRGNSAMASVKLPSVPIPGSFGPGGRGEAQAVKEVRRRQGSGNVQKDGGGGQRGEGGRGRWPKRGGRGRRGRGGGLNAGNMGYGAERVDGGMMVKS
ncbi:hypothetical protein OH77DRAFT_1181878 [Trametes cingulata]|nr:hypothetical protein OH77DRAFT_1181878 [Trametes cingulata]